MISLLDRSFAAETSALGEVRNAVRNACIKAGHDDEATENWVLAVNEAAMNVIQHAYDFAPGQSFRVVASCEDGMFYVTICDNGKLTGMADLKPRPLNEIRPGGLGVHFIRTLTDTMAYLPSGDGWRNRLRLGKQLPPAADNKKSQGSQAQ